MVPSNRLILCCPLLILSSIFSSIRVFSSEPALSIRWPENWSFIFSINPSNKYSGFVSRSLCYFNKCRYLQCSSIVMVYLMCCYVSFLQCQRPGFNPWKRKWQPTLVSLLGEFHGQKSLVGYSPWDSKESNTTEWLSLHFLSRAPSPESWWNIPVHCSEGIFKVSESCSVVSDSLQPHVLYSPRNSLSQNTRVGSRSLFQGIFPTQGSNPGLLHCRWILYQLSHQGSPFKVRWHFNQ